MPDAPPPSRRQLDVLGAYLTAGSVEEAAKTLRICPGYARQVMSRLYGRIGVRNAAQAVAFLDDHAPGWRLTAA